jgi:hypothetical protein
MKKSIVAGMVATAILTLGCAWEAASPNGPIIEAPADRPDCDHDDLYGNTPDPDCAGIWLGSPKAKAPVAPARTPGPVRKTKRR